ncbi:MAG: hypothetical protein MJY90_03430 [Bacteroidaceae bacterium]|nr:hypothetical protein [Bacteroidaceae bacterium]
MKQKYQKPNITIINLQCNTTLLSGSNTVNSTDDLSYPYCLYADEVSASNAL